MTSDIFRVLAQHAYLEGRMFVWWQRGKKREIAPDVFWAPR